MKRVTLLLALWGASLQGATWLRAHAVLGKDTVLVYTVPDSWQFVQSSGDSDYSASLDSPEGAALVDIQASTGGGADRDTALKRLISSLTDYTFGETTREINEGQLPVVWTELSGPGVGGPVRGWVAAWSYRSVLFTLVGTVSEPLYDRYEEDIRKVLWSFKPLPKPKPKE